MSRFAMAHATGSDGDRLAQSCGATLKAAGAEGPGFVYATSVLAPEFAGIVETLRKATGIESWTGTVGAGVCTTGREIFDKPAVVALTCGLDGNACKTIPTLRTADAVGGGDHAIAAALGVVHADPRNGGAGDIVAELAQRRDVYLVGGLTAGDVGFPQTAGGRAGDGGVSGILLGGRLSVAVGLTQGCSPIGTAHEVTGSSGQVLVGLDGRRAFDALAEDIGIADGADPRPWLANVHAAVPVPGSDDADYVVRNLVGIDAAKGLVAIADTLEAGDRVLFVRRDRESAERDMERMLAGLKGRLMAPAKAGLYFSCVARGPNLFNAPSHEMSAIRRTFGDIPIAGFFGNGEICNGRVYGYTGVLTLFC